LHQSFDKLLFFGVPKVLLLYGILKSQTLDTGEGIQGIGFLFENNPTTTKNLEKALKASVLCLLNSNVCMSQIYTVTLYGLMVAIGDLKK